jgi:hypothetical protein
MRNGRAANRLHPRRELTCNARKFGTTMAMIRLASWGVGHKKRETA